MPDGITDAKNGITGGYKGENAIIIRAMIAFTAIAWYNAAEIIILVLVVFKRYSGLYFWSLLITAISIIPYQVGAWLKQVGEADAMGMIILSSIGWVVMVPGSSLVLYSRLHCITQNRKLLRGILYMIIINAIVLTVPTNVLSLGSNSSKYYLFTFGYSVMEKIQMTVFSLQELIISFIYLVEVRRVLKVIDDGRFRKIMWELGAINIAIIVLDVALLAVEYLGLYQIEVTLKGMCYSIKLKLEFGVLSKLVKIATARQGVYDLQTETDSSGKNAMTYQGHGAWLTGLSASPPTLTTLPSNTTYSTGKRNSTWGSIWATGNPFASTHAEVQKRHRDFEDTVTFSQTEPLPKPSLIAEHISHPPAVVTSRRSSTEDLYPGRLD
ncbi:integral membrane protein, partial [Aureobasidium melanogenum]